MTRTRARKPRPTAKPDDRKTATGNTPSKPTPGRTLVTLQRRRSLGRYTPAQLAEARAALASATARLPIPHILWLAQLDGRASARLADGTHLIHTHERDPEFTAYLRCPTGGLHTEPVTSERDLKAARAVTNTCTRRHDDPDQGDQDDSPCDWHKAITHGVHQAVPSHLSALTTDLHMVKKTPADTQPLSLDDIDAGLADRTTDTEQPKEHPADG